MGSGIAAYRIGQKLGQEPAMVAMGIIPILWLIVMGINNAQWNRAIPAAPWATNDFFDDRTAWDGVPNQKAPVEPAPPQQTPST